MVSGGEIMKCIIDTTVRLKELLVQHSNKSLLKVAGKELIEHQLITLKKNSITQVYIILSPKSDIKTYISRLAKKMELDVTFLTAYSDDISTNKSIIAAKAYMKEEFLYWPIGRLVSVYTLKMIKEIPLRKAQWIGTAIYSGNDHPQINKTCLAKLKKDVYGNMTLDKDDVVNQEGVDLGIYKCSPLIFKVIKQFNIKKKLNWNQLLYVIARRKQGAVCATKSNNWGIINHYHDIDIYEKHQQYLKAQKVKRHTFEKKWLLPLDKLFVALMMKIGESPKIWLSGFIASYVISIVLILTASPIALFVAGLLLSFTLLNTSNLLLLPDIRSHHLFRPIFCLIQSSTVLIIQFTLFFALLLQQSLLWWHVMVLLSLSLNMIWCYESRKVNGWGDYLSDWSRSNVIISGIIGFACLLGTSGALSVLSIFVISLMLSRIDIHSIQTKFIKH